MKNLICYKTKHGATAKYMIWLADAINAEIKTFDEIGRSFDFSIYDNIIVSSGTYVSYMPLVRFLKKYWMKLQQRNVIVVAIGAVPSDNPWSDFSYKHIPNRIRNQVKYFKLMGETPESSRIDGYTSPVKKENLEPVVTEINQKNRR